MSRGVAEKDTPCSVGRISRRRNPPTAAPEQPSGGLRFANPPYALLRNASRGDRQWSVRGSSSNFCQSGFAPKARKLWIVYSCFKIGAVFRIHAAAMRSPAPEVVHMI